MPSQTGNVIGKNDMNFWIEKNNLKPEVGI